MDIFTNDEMTARRREHLLYGKLAGRLIDYRERNNISQQQFSNVTGIPLEMIQQLENMDASIGYYSLAYEKLGIDMNLDIAPQESKGREYKI